MTTMHDTFLLSVPVDGLLNVIEQAQPSRQRVVVERLEDGVAYYTLLEAYVPADAAVTETLPPQCSF